MVLFFTSFKLMLPIQMKNKLVRLKTVLEKIRLGIIIPR
jgi:hypothetical protein